MLVKFILRYGSPKWHVCNNGAICFRQPLLKIAISQFWRNETHLSILTSSYFCNLHLTNLTRLRFWLCNSCMWDTPGNLKQYMYWKDVHRKFNSGGNNLTLGKLATNSMSGYHSRTLARPRQICLISPHWLSGSQQSQRASFLPEFSSVIGCQK